MLIQTVSLLYPLEISCQGDSDKNDLSTRVLLQDDQKEHTSHIMANECLLGNRKGVSILMSNTYGWVGKEMNEFIYILMTIDQLVVNGGGC